MSILKYLVMIITVSISFKTNAQLSIPKYYSLINSAEMAIVEKQIPKALSFYEQAYAVNPVKYFSEDLYKAFHCAMDSKEYMVAEKYLTILLKRGLKTKFLNKYIFKYYNEDDKLKVIAMVKRHPNDTIHDNPTNRFIRKLIDLDQNTRFYWIPKTNGAYMVDSTYKMDQYCANELFKLFVSLGKIPNQDDLGNMEWDAPTVQINYSIIILHNTMANGNNMPCEVFDTMMYKAVFTYDFKPTWFRSVFFNVVNSHKDQCIHYKKNSITFPLIKAEHLPLYDYKKGKEIAIDTKEYFDEIKRINKERKKIGLSTLEEYWAKHRFMKQERNTAFSKYAFL